MPNDMMSLPSMERATPNTTLRAVSAMSVDSHDEDPEKVRLRREVDSAIHRYGAMGRVLRMRDVPDVPENKLRLETPMTFEQRSDSYVTAIPLKRDLARRRRGRGLISASPSTFPSSDVGVEDRAKGAVPRGVREESDVRTKAIMRRRTITARRSLMNHIHESHSGVKRVKVGGAMAIGTTTLPMIVSPPPPSDDALSPSVDAGLTSFFFTEVESVSWEEHSRRWGGGVGLLSPPMLGSHLTSPQDGPFSTTSPSSNVSFSGGAAPTSTLKLAKLVSRRLSSSELLSDKDLGTRSTLIDFRVVDSAPRVNTPQSVSHPQANESFSTSLLRRRAQQLLDDARRSEEVMKSHDKLLSDMEVDRQLKQRKKFAAINLSKKLPMRVTAPSILQHVDRLIHRDRVELQRLNEHDRTVAAFLDVEAMVEAAMPSTTLHEVMSHLRKLIVDDKVVPHLALFRELLAKVPTQELLIDEISTFLHALATDVFHMSVSDADFELRQHASHFVGSRIKRELIPRLESAAESPE